MTTLEIKGDWNITKGKLKQKWAKLTDSDLQYVEGKQEELVGRIQKAHGRNPRSGRKGDQGILLLLLLQLGSLTARAGLVESAQRNSVLRKQSRLANPAAR